MSRKRRLSNSRSARLMRSAVAYDRLAAKAYHAGNMRLSGQYSEKSVRLRGQAERARRVNREGTP